MSHHANTRLRANGRERTLFAEAAIPLSAPFGLGEIPVAADLRSTALLGPTPLLPNTMKAVDTVSSARVTAKPHKKY